MGFKVLTSAGAIKTGTIPTFALADATGTLPADHGGTGATTLTGILKGNGAGAITAITIPADATKYLDGTGVYSVPVTGGTGWTRVTLPADVANAEAVANTLTDVTGLSFTVTSGRVYTFKFFIWYTSAASTTGSRWTINGPTTDRLMYQSTYNLSGSSMLVNDAMDLYELPSTATASSLASNGNNSTNGGIVRMEGVIVPSANGTVIARFASEVTVSAITAKEGSFVEYVEITP